MTFIEVVLFGSLIYLVICLWIKIIGFVIDGIPEGYEDENGFHYGRKENK